jgi:hypothetical protein
LERAERAAPTAEEADTAYWRRLVHAFAHLFAALPPELRQRIRPRIYGQLLRLIKREPVEGSDPIWRPLREIRELAWEAATGRYRGPLAVRPELLAELERVVA